MKEVEVIEINDNDYIILKEVKHNNVSFLFLSNVNDEEDTLIRKVSLEDENTVVPLASEEEFELACNLLIKEGLI